MSEKCLKIEKCLMWDPTFVYHRLLLLIVSEGVNIYAWLRNIFMHGDSLFDPTYVYHRLLLLIVSKE